ncbi:MULTISPECIES: LuxR C-terminal-related transcriptional regulator [unclassified Wenzhouxiangella]|uniref:helix-turn-helix transcriptional regulator n=1 Tax=unclassified Wenzhouxiangella TaxID=2613841 RepID=UPI001C6F0F27|nr:MULTISPECIES: LuxR C-terminal-related transcriptional regulator [unclassified Wenzhouxiangella]
MSNDTPQTPGRNVLLITFGAIATLIGWDLLSDYNEGVEPLHVIVELTVLLLAATMFGYVLTRMIRGRRQLNQMHTRLDSVQAESRRWRERYQSTIRGLSEAIQEQFEAWQLSKAEAEIALLLLKGLSLKEIAAVRTTGERTVREQARAIYRKAGLTGRSELSAFFLEDLLLPDPEAMIDRE